ncbi:carbohydrate ABC transporter permease [Ruania alba]|uniref:carbohydrate ABC transporter permease n=1 Tax=Ruania alba TaxID=648782 RepID=UPI0015873F05|nr:carbohydrate ABC transporter permease [Ruania alba]
MIGLAVLVMIFPLYWMLSTALKDLQEALAVPPTLWPTSPSLEAFPDALSEAPFGRYVANTVLVASVTAVANVFIGAMTGYGLARGAFRGKRLVLAMILIAAMVPSEATFIPNYVLIRELGWYDTYAALIVPWLVTAFSIFLFRQSFLTFPESLAEAGRLDGASEWRIFWSIVFPIARSTSLTVLILSFLWSWNAFLWPLLVTSSTEMRTLQLGLSVFQTEGGVYVNLLMAATTLAVIPVIVMFAITQKYVINGIGQGAIK